MTPRNPPWTREELILALDLYFRVEPTRISKDDPAIVELSAILNRLPFHEDRPDRDKFRNPNGVYMKLCNFLRLDQGYAGTGLSHGGKLEEVVWNEFSESRSRLTAAAEPIRALALAATADHNQIGKHEIDEPPEGILLLREHKLPERKPTIVEGKTNEAKDEEGRVGL